MFGVCSWCGLVFFCRSFEGHLDDWISHSNSCEINVIQQQIIQQQQQSLFC